MNPHCSEDEAKACLRASSAIDHRQIELTQASRRVLLGILRQDMRDAVTKALQQARDEEAERFVVIRIPRRKKPVKLESRFGAAAATASKAASAATAGGMGGAVILGLGADVFGVLIAGLVGIAGVAVKAAIEIHFKRKHYRLALARARGVEPDDEQ